MKVLQNNAKTAQIQGRLNKWPYISKNNLPGQADGRILQILQTNKRYPDLKTNPNFHYWYILMKQFSSSAINKWITDELYHDQNDTLVSDFVKLYNPVKDKDSHESSAQQPSPSEIIKFDSKSTKIQGPLQFDYTIDIFVKNQSQQKLDALQKLLEEYKAQVSETEFKDQPRFRILCRMQAAHYEQMINRVNKCIEYENIEMKRQKRPRKAVNLNLQKVPSEGG